MGFNLFNFQLLQMVTSGIAFMVIMVQLHIMYLEANKETLSSILDKADVSDYSQLDEF